MKAIPLIVGLWLAALAFAQQEGGGGGEHVTRHHAVIAHGAIMGLAFAFLFPIGSMLIRTASFRNMVWVHAGIQLFAYALALAGLGLGVYIAVKPDPLLTTSGNGHPIIGIIVVGALLFQPIGGLVHHNNYIRRGKPTFWALAHTWWGRIFITLGIIDGGLGLMLSANTVKGEIAYGVVAGVIWSIWVAVAAWSYITTRNAINVKSKKGLGSSVATSDKGIDREGETTKTF